SPIANYGIHPSTDHRHRFHRPQRRIQDYRFRRAAVNQWPAVPQGQPPECKGFSPAKCGLSRDATNYPTWPFATSLLEIGLTDVYCTEAQEWVEVVVDYVVRL
ncbi:uncharacterized protein B0I36DRAFT_435994, partial [Microdochium trichocladiopsis]